MPLEAWRCPACGLVVNAEPGEPHKACSCKTEPVLMEEGYSQEG